MAGEAGDCAHASTVSRAPVSGCRRWGRREGVSLQPWCVGDLLFVGVCPGTTEPVCPLPLNLHSVSELINVLTSVRRAHHFWSPCSPAAAMRCFGLVRCTARAVAGRERGIMWFPSGFSCLAGRSSCSLLPTAKRQMWGARSALELGTCPSSSRECLQGYFWPRHYPNGFGG